jgi:VWFA-related protein
MRSFILTAAGVLACLLVATGVQGEDDPAPTAPGAGADPLKYKIEIDKVFPSFREGALYVTVQFKVRRVSDNSVATDVSKEEIVVEEDRQRVANLEIFQPRAEKLTTVLAMDISGSMANKHKIDEAKRAAHAFLDNLHARADTGLILFDHEMKVMEDPGKDPSQFGQHREKVRRLIDAAQPAGGTAYLDAASRALRMIKPFPGRRAVLVMTDGVDMNSKQTLAQVIADAKAIGVPVYTLGIGDPGRNEPVTTVLVLDHSGSMKGKASDTDTESKIEALHTAASRFVDLMRTHSRTTLLPFSTAVEPPQLFGAEPADRKKLKESIQKLQPQGGTLLYDATFAGIEALMAEHPKGKKAVVVLTDGKDEAPGSRRSAQGVIDRAKEAHVPLYMLGLGKRKEINEEVMTRMSDETGGKYHYAGDQQRLIELFEKLSIDIHDDGIDEGSLKKLAEETGGKYYPARDASQLRLIYEELSTELQSTYTVTFLSRKAQHDGTARGIDISIVRNGQRVSDVGSVDYNVHGVVVAEMDYRVYLALLVLLGGLLVAPAGVRRLYKVYGGA